MLYRCLPAGLPLDKPAWAGVLAVLLCSAAAAAPTGDLLTQEEKAWLAAHPDIRLAPDPSYPPIEFLSGPQNRHTGIAADYVHLVEQRLGIRFKLEPNAQWDFTLAKLRDKQVDLVASCVDTPQRREFALFTAPYLDLRNVIIVRNTAPDELRVEQLAGLTVDVVAGHAVRDFLVARGITVHEVPNFRTGLRRVAFGSSDAMVGDLAAASYLIERDRITNLTIAGSVGYNYKIAFACRNDWPELQRMLEKALSDIAADERQKIFSKWVHLHQFDSGMSRSLAMAIGFSLLGMAAVLGGGMAWNRSLKRQVRLRTEQLDRELTERSAAEAQRRRLEEELRQAQKMEVMGTMASGIAHDFNNLLTVISGFTELARTHLPTEHAAHEPLRVVENAVHDASGLTRSLLSLSRKGTALRAPTDVGRLLRDASRFLRRILPATVQVEVDLTDERLTVDADAAQLRQVLLNLATNARDAMPDGGKLRIELRPGQIRDAADGRPTAVIGVEDTGEGIHEGLLDRVVEPFFTTKPPGKGTGLGLAMVQAIVAEHEGRMDIESIPGRGTRVVIELPTCDPLPEQGEGKTEAAPALAGQGRPVLLAEDSPQVRAVVVRALQRAGFDVTEVGSGEEAVAALRADPSRHHLAVLDVDLPGIDGVEVSRRLRNLRPHLPVILISGNAEVQVEEGTDLQFLRKPFAMPELVLLAAQMLESKTVRKP